MKVECGICEFWQCDDKCKCKCHVAQQTTLIATHYGPCEYCGEVCYRGAAHNARVEEGAKWREDKRPAERDLDTPPPDPLRTRVPVWRCPVCRDKFYSSEALFTHREMKHGPPATQPLSPSPEIRYQLRNWHHVTCLVAGGACTCLAQREALIAKFAEQINELQAPLKEA